MRLRVRHTTRYIYPAPASESHNELRLMPSSDSDQTCLDFRLAVTPAAPLSAYDLPSGRVHHFIMRAPHRELVIAAESLVVTYRQNPFEKLNLVAEDREFYAREDARQSYREYLAPTQRVPLHPETDRIAAAARRHAGVGAASFLISLTRLLHRVIASAPGSARLHPALRHVLENRQGVCQDFAHLMLGVCRRQGIPARYVSGYLYTGEDRQEEKGAEEEMTEAARALERLEERLGLSTRPDSGLISGDSMHAWVECLMPDAQWRGFDPTNNLLVNDYYIKVHTGRDYGDVPPIRGVYQGSSAHSRDVSVRVLREQ